MDKVEILREVMQVELDPYEIFFIDRETQGSRLNNDLGNPHSNFSN